MKRKMSLLVHICVLLLSREIVPPDLLVLERVLPMEYVL